LSAPAGATRLGLSISRSTYFTDNVLRAALTINSADLIKRNFRFWPKADIQIAPRNVRFQG
jgi:hypothetical protein